MSRPSVVLNANPRINPILLFAGVYAIVDGYRMLNGHGSLVSIRFVPSSSSSSDPSSPSSSSSNPNSTSSTSTTNPSTSTSPSSFRFRLPNPFSRTKESPSAQSGKPTPPTLTAEERLEVEKAQQNLQEISSRINSQRRELKASIDEANKRRREAQELGKRIQKRSAAENANGTSGSGEEKSRERSIDEVHSAKDEVVKPAQAQRRISGSGTGTGKVESAWMSLNGVPIPRLETLIAPFTKKD